MGKDEIRKAVKSMKRQLSDTEKAEAAERCFARVERREEFASARRILVYSSLPDEISTTRFLERWKEKKELFLPRVAGDNLEITAYRPEELAPGAFGISEPSALGTLDIREMDAVIVPGVAFDRSGNRLGRGKGYYDRLLAGSSCVKIGVGYQCQLLPDPLPAAPHDVRMDIVVTDRETLPIRPPIAAFDHTDL